MTTENSLNGINKKIAFIAYDGCLSSSISFPIEMLSAAIDTARAGNVTSRNSGVNQVQVFGRKRKIHCAGQIFINTDDHPSTIDNPYLVFLPAIWRNPLVILKKERYLIALIKQWHELGTKICAIGSSSIFLAEAGLLNQRAATTHWSQIENFRKRYPTVKLQADFLITQSENIYCASSVNSGSDLIIHFIDLLFNQSIAQHVEANFSPEIRKSYASSLYIQDQKSPHKDEDIIRLQYWLNENFKQNTSCKDMASMLGISVRSLNRRFKESIQQSPIQYLQSLKIDHAKELLQHSNLTTNEIATQCGFNDISYFCSTFKRLTGMPSNTYRSAVKTKLFSTPT